MSVARLSDPAQLKTIVLRGHRRYLVFHNIGRIAFAQNRGCRNDVSVREAERGQSFSLGYFFSLFTIQANILAATTLALTALIRRAERSRLFDARGAATFYITITGVVFALTPMVRPPRLPPHPHRIRQLRRPLPDPRRARRRLVR